MAPQINATGPGGAALRPIEIAENVDAPMGERNRAIRTLTGIRGGKHQRGEAVYKQVCSACHKIGDLGKKFGPELTDIASRMNKEAIIRSIIMPNDKISKGYETVSILTLDGETFAGFVLKEDEKMISLGVADPKGANQAKQVDILKDDIEILREMKASSMPEGLIQQIAPIEFLDLIAYLGRQKAVAMEVKKDGWILAKFKNAPKLRKHNGFNEISREAEIQLGPTMTNSGWHESSHLLLTDAPQEGDLDFVFHSAHEADDPAITIRLPKESEVRHIWLQNRLSSQFHRRAEGLTVWTSLDGKKFKKVWTADKMKREWMADLPSGTKARYLRIGLDGSGTFHLNRVAVYGE
ncbi:MAG: discoidin domain-containing protein [Planctomycetota bacterium]